MRNGWLIENSGSLPPLGTISYFRCNKISILGAAVPQANSVSASRLSGQHLHRTLVAIPKAGGSLSARTAGRLPSQTRHQRLDWVLQL